MLKQMQLRHAAPLFLALAFTFALAFGLGFLSHESSTRAQNSVMMVQLSNEW